MLMPDATHELFPDADPDAPGVRIIEAARGVRHVHGHLNVPYAEVDGRTLHLHVLQSCLDLTYHSWAEMTAERLPAIVFVQGSGWGEQEMGTAVDFWSRFAHRGYVVALVEYRPSDVAPFPAQIEDAHAAVRFLAEHHEQFCIDPQRIAVAGDSSGGHTALMMHATAGQGRFGERPDAPAVRAYVDFYGPTDLSIGNQLPTTVDHEGADSAEGMLLGGRPLAEVPEQVAEASPISWLDADRVSTEGTLAPLLIVHGTKDRIVPFEHSRRHHQALRELGQPVEFVAVRDADHGITAALLTDELADLLDAFLREHLG